MLRRQIRGNDSVTNARGFPVWHLSKSADIFVTIIIVTEDVTVPLGSALLAMLYCLSSLEDTFCSCIILQASNLQHIDTRGHHEGRWAIVWVISPVGLEVLYAHVDI